MPARRSSGYSLVEMLIVCAVLVIAAAVALPSAQPAAEFSADAAAGEIVQALRFTRQEAMRTGALRMLGCDQANSRLSVYVPDANGAQTAAVRDPLRKTDYVVVPGQAPAGSGFSVSNCNFVFADGQSATALAFDANGNPVRGTGDAKSQATALSSGTIVIGAGKVTRTIAIGLSGRVTTS
jgi:prepilin-type N-terminal cleavage/methylation domain-containing protein